MRLRCWWRRTALSTALLLGGAAVVSAQVVAFDPPAPGSDTAPVAAETESGGELAADTRSLIERLSRVEDEMNSLRGQLNEERRVNAQRTSLINELMQDKKDEKKADGKSDGKQEEKKDEKKDAGPKKVDTIVKPTMAWQGRMFFDHIMFEDHPGLRAASGVDRLNETGFNTVRFGVTGTIYENLAYAADVEFEGTETDFKDMYLDVQNMPALGTVRLGHFKEPFSLEELTSSRFHTFMQRSSAHGAFVPSRNFGVMAFNNIRENDNWSWYAGTFRNDSPDNPSARASHIGDEGDWVFTGRVAGLLYYDEPSQGRYLVHVGGAYSKRNDLTVASFSSRPELGTQNGYLTSTFNGDDDWNLFGTEAAILWGPASVQAEYYVAQPGDEEVNGGYVQATYFLTGESRGYKKDLKRFDRVKPIEDFFRVSTCDGVCMGRGAWELKTRYSWVDLNAGNAGLRGYQDGFSAGANWYWNPYTRMMFDYVHEDVNLLNGVTGANDMFGMRFQIDF